MEILSTSWQGLEKTVVSCFRKAGIAKKSASPDNDEREGGDELGSPVPEVSSFDSRYEICLITVSKGTIALCGWKRQLSNPCLMQLTALRMAKQSPSWQLELHLLKKCWILCVLGKAMMQW